MQTWMYFFPARNMFHVIWLSLRCIMEVRTARKTGSIWIVFSQWMSIVSRAKLFFIFFFFFFFFDLAMIIIDRSPSAADNKISSSGFPIAFSPNNIYSSSKEKVMRINTVITKGKMLWSLIKFSQLILQENVWRSVLEICLWILVLQESTTDIVIHVTRNGWITAKKCHLRTKFHCFKKGNRSCRVWCTDCWKVTIHKSNEHKVIE